VKVAKAAGISFSAFRYDRLLEKMHLSNPRQPIRVVTATFSVKTISVAIHQQCLFARRIVRRQNNIAESLRPGLLNGEQFNPAVSLLIPRIEKQLVALMNTHIGQLPVAPHPAFIPTGWAITSGMPSPFRSMNSMRVSPAILRSSRSESISKSAMNGRISAATVFRSAALSVGFRSGEFRIVLL
jgi:hypothetical protein